MSSAFNWVLDVHPCQYDVYLYSNNASFTGPVYMSKAASPVSRAGLSHINRPSVVANFQDLLYTLFTIHFCPSTRNSFWDYESSCCKDSILSDRVHTSISHRVILHLNNLKPCLSIPHWLYIFHRCFTSLFVTNKELSCLCRLNPTIFTTIIDSFNIKQEPDII